jgi:hypothetical protein
VAKGGPACSAGSLRDLISAYNAFAQIERRSATWLLLPSEYEKKHLVTAGDYFLYDHKYQPATSNFSAALKTKVAAKANQMRLDAGIGTGLKMLAWQRPSPAEWDLCVRQLCARRQVQVVALLLVCMRAAQRGFDMQRLTLDDILWEEAGCRFKGNAIPYVVLAPEGAKMHKVGPRVQCHRHPWCPTAIRRRTSELSAVRHRCLPMSSVVCRLGDNARTVGRHA